VKLLFILPLFPLLMIGADTFVPEMERVRMLKFVWFPLLLPAPFVAIAIYFVIGLRLRKRIGGWSWGLGYLAAVPIFFLPTVLLALNTRSLALDHSLQPAELNALKSWFPHPFVHYSSGHDRKVLLVRKNDDSGALAEYARTNRARANK
jgi:hypothetical protein